MTNLLAALAYLAILAVAVFGAVIVAGSGGKRQSNPPPVGVRPAPPPAPPRPRRD